MVIMQTTTGELQQIVAVFSEKIRMIPETEFSKKPLPNKWSKKEVLGHLIDSGQNNLRRFICGQYETRPPRIRYDQDFWVAANGYQAMRKDDVLALWILINGRIGHVLENMPAENYHRTCDTGSQHSDLRSIEWLAMDYVKHLKHHLNQIIAGSFDVVYP